MCAHPVSPSGGPKDISPPEFVKSDPPMYSKNFNSNKIRIYFNEFVQLKDINNQVIISPPMTKMPAFKLKGKSVIVEFDEELKKNTTYNIFFGEAIVDLTENNPTSNFQYVFSTGNVLDSLSIKGRVFDAFDLTTIKDNNVMLYLDNNDTIPFDSLPLMVRPYYLTKTNEQGEFKLNNLPYQPFKIFALFDQNSNMIFDQPNEKIAFIDSLIYPQFMQPIKLDTSLTDTLALDTVRVDQQENIDLEMYLFQEQDSVQRFLKASLAKENQLNLIFKRPTSNPKVYPLNIPDGIDWSIVEINQTNDTLIYWLQNIDQDSITIEISDNEEILDTVKVALKKNLRGRKQKDDEEKEIPIALKINDDGKILKLNKNPKLLFNYPVRSYDFSKITFFKSDSVPIGVEFYFIDPGINRNLSITHEWEPATSYKMIIPDSVFFDIYGHSHDSIRINYKTKSIEEYGNLFVDIQISPSSHNHIIQLFNKDKIIKEIHLAENERITFEYLDPGTYVLKVIYDMNNNGEWDTGDYKYNIQPEKVDFFPNEITIRANWDVEEIWEL
jgi:hypothetical protein